MKSAVTALIQIQDRGLNEDTGLVNRLRSWTLKTYNVQNNKKREFREVEGAYWFRVVRATVHPWFRSSHFLCMPYLMNSAC